jgi:hypothetical protein
MYFIVTTLPILSPFAATEPYHLDFFVYFNAMQKPLVYTDFLQPRPLSLILVRVIGWFGLGEKEVMLFFSFLSFIAISSSLLACESINGKKTIFYNRLFYVIAAMLLPTYFVIHQWDFGGVVATIFFCLAIVVASKPINYLRTFTIIIILWLSFEFKPTWMAAAPIAFGAFWLIDRNRKDALFLAIKVTVLGVIILVKDYMLGSAFIITTDINAPYKIGNFDQIITTFKFYTFNAVTYSSIATVTGILLLFKCNYKVVLIVISIAFGAILPISMLPNHLFPMYSWYASLFVLGVIVTARSPKLNITTIVKSTIFLQCIYVLSCLTGLIGIITLSVMTINNGNRNFYLAAQKIIANDLKALKEINGLPQGKKLLIGTMSTPFSPFNNWEYANRMSGGKLKDYVVRNDFMVFTQQLIPPATGVKIGNIKTEDYDYFMDLSNPFGPNLIAISDLSKNALENYKKYLSCPALSKIRYLPETHPQKIFETTRCYADLGDTDKALSYLHNNWKYVVDAGAWGYFVEGQIYEAEGNCYNAMNSYKLANKIESSLAFTTALNRLEKTTCGKS